MRFRIYMQHLFTYDRRKNRFSEEKKRVFNPEQQRLARYGLSFVCDYNVRSV